MCTVRRSSYKMLTNDKSPIITRKTLINRRRRLGGSRRRRRAFIEKKELLKVTYVWIWVACKKKMSDQFDPLDKVQRPHQHLLSRDEHRQPCYWPVDKRERARFAPLLRGAKYKWRTSKAPWPFFSLLSIRKLMHNANYSTILRAMCLRSQSC